MGLVSLLEDIEKRLTNDMAREYRQLWSSPDISETKCKEIAERVVSQAVRKLKQCEDILSARDLDLAADFLELRRRHDHLLSENEEFKRQHRTVTTVHESKIKELCDLHAAKLKTLKEGFEEDLRRAKSQMEHQLDRTSDERIVDLATELTSKEHDVMRLRDKLLTETGRLNKLNSELDAENQKLRAIIQRNNFNSEPVGTSEQTGQNYPTQGDFAKLLEDAEAQSTK